MKLQTFLEHHGIQQNPFTEEDAQTDPVFKDHCIDTTYHPIWDKVYGDPADPSTSVVFGQKGSGKTALRLQIVRHVRDYNREHPAARLFVIEYDDFNPFLDRFRDRMSHRNQRADRALAQWKLWDHMDAILSLGVTQLVDAVLAGDRTKSDGKPTSAVEVDLAGRKLDHLLARDLLLLAACFDQSPSESFRQRWVRLRSRLKYRYWLRGWRAMLGVAVTVGIFGLIAALQQWDWLASVWPYLFAACGWIPWFIHFISWHLRARQVCQRLRVIPRDAGPMREVLTRFSAADLAGQPLPNKDSTDDRYEMLVKLQSVLKALGYSGMLVLVDRVDEPHLINGSSDLMKSLIWPLLDNKFLKHPGIGFKLLLPIELSYFVQREDREFHQRARLDKQNMIPSLEWTGESLYDVANARLKACGAAGANPSLRALLDSSISDQRLVDALRGLRVPRHLFKFLYRLMVAHLNAHTDESPAWQISSATFESVLSVFMRDQDALERGVGAG